MSATVPFGPATPGDTGAADEGGSRDRLDMVAEPGLTMTIYAAEPGSSTEHALALLASWAAAEDIAAARPT